MDGDPQDEEDEWYGGGGFDFGGFEFDDELQESNAYTIPQSEKCYDNLLEVMIRIGAPSTEELDPCQDYQERIKLVDGYMGTMAQCRGQRGEELRETGAIQAILGTIMELLERLPPATGGEPDDTSDAAPDLATKLAIACWGAARDLGCGSNGNREALREIEIDGVGGMQLSSIYLERYRGIRWDELDPLQLNLLTTVVGAMRNVTHSTTANCAQLHEFGVSVMLIWRLKQSTSSDSETTALALPDASSPWREGAFRSASTLINMAEKCAATADLCGKDTVIVRLLVESWGGSQKKQPLLHLGLAAILQSAKDNLQPELYDDCWDLILSNEKHRKLVARKREEERKQVSVSGTTNSNDPII
jgi:hypothetical protein